MLLSFGNCQALALSAIAADLPTLVDRFDIRYLPSHPALGTIEYESDLPQRCELVWEQVGVNQRLPFREALPTSTRRFRFAELSFPPLWPSNCADPRNIPDPPNHWGRFPYGDRLALQLMSEGYFGEPGFRAWSERGLEVFPDLNRLFDLEIARARRRSVDVDIEMTYYIENNWTNERLFATINHPSNRLLWSLALHILDASLNAIPRSELDAARQRFMSPGPGAIDMDWFQMIVHPRVAEAFKLQWCTESALYRCEVPGINHRLTRSEFLADYYMVV